MSNYMSSYSVILVLFILLVIVLGVWGQGGVFMNNQCCENNNTGNGFVLILVLYILLAIILGNCIS